MPAPPLSPAASPATFLLPATTRRPASARSTLPNSSPQPPPPGAPTKVTLTGSSGTIPSGQSLSFSIVVAPVAANASTPTGSIQLFANGNVLGSPIALASGKASVTLPDTLSLGSNMVTASYSGDPTFSPANSSALALLVSAGSTQSLTTVTATPNPTRANQVVLFTVTVSPAAGSGAPPTGSVTLFVNGQTASTATLFNGTATFNFFFSAATFPISASYTGNGLYGPSMSPQVNVVSTAGISTTVLSGATSLPAASPLSVTATINNLSIFGLTSSVTFYDGTTPLLPSLLVTKAQNATSAAVTYTGTAALATGIHSITAVFTGDINNLTSTSPPLIVAVGIPQAITVTPAATTLTLSAGASTGNTDALTITSAGAFAGPVTFACTVAYNGTGTTTYLPTCTPSAASVTLTPQGTATTTLTIGTTVPHGIQAPGRAYVWQPAAGVLLAGLAFLPLLRRRKPVIVLGMLLTAGLFALSGCGGKSTATTTPPAPLVGTTPGSYTITVVSSGTGTGTVSATTAIALTVQ